MNITRGWWQRGAQWGRAIVNLCWWFNTPHVSFESGRAREKLPKILVLDGPWLLWAQPAVSRIAGVMWPYGTSHTMSVTSPQLSSSSSLREPFCVNCSPAFLLAWPTDCA